MNLPNNPDSDIHDLELLAYFAEQRGWQEVADTLSEQTSGQRPDSEGVKADWQWLFDAFDEQSAV